MSGRFFDTNVILYLTGREPTKVDVARTLIAGGGVVSVQVLNELANVLSKKFCFDWPDTVAFITDVSTACRIVPVTLEVHSRGVAYAARYRLSVYDSMIVAAAVLSGCTTLYSEDMHDGLVIDGLTIRNPFRQA